MKLNFENFEILVSLITDFETIVKNGDTAQ